MNNKHSENKRNNIKKVYVKEIRKIRNGVDNIAKSIYNNFASLSHSEQLGHNIKEIKQMLTSDNFIGFFVYDESKIVSYLVGEIKNLNDGRIVYYITYIYVGKQYRHKKIGSQLMKMLIYKCRNWGIGFITLTCDIKNNKVMNFYKNLGFKQDPILKNMGRHEVFTLYL